FPLEFSCVRARRKDRLLHIRSAILKTSQPRAAKLKPQNSMIAIIALTSIFHRKIAIFLADGK
ncbi:MAG TPA: hypothetical protein VLI91_12040, partial [Roseiarcus sp.]|nr:hypothetical protein [Roseiarcus sp.]